MKLLTLLFLLVLNSAFAIDFKIEKNEILKTIIHEMKAPGSTPEIYPIAEKYRLDLTLKDLIDQTTIITENHKVLNERLSTALNSDGKNINFLKWLEELKAIATEDESLFKSLDKGLYLQFYSTAGVALLPD